jgi:cytochrome c oxidase subunit II
MAMRWGIVVLRGITGMALIALPSATTGGQRTAGPKIIHIVAERFAFTPSEISVEEGTRVELRISSDDTSHGFRLTGPGDPGSPGAIDLEIPKRGRGDVRATFQATAVGRYTFECSRVCGAGHDFMRGTLRVTPRSANSPIRQFDPLVSGSISQTVRRARS